ncbi:hypothetical protein [Streptomyces kaempferi]|uniref:Secreted protein n=1 Tax=Streptomyces kaempferi TaxID=333725 RepID=A0ABW3XPS0_9ACTN
MLANSLKPLNPRPYGALTWLLLGFVVVLCAHHLCTGLGVPVPAATSTPNVAPLALRAADSSRLVIHARTDTAIVAAFTAAA